MFELTGKTALITGGNGGIGLAMASGLARAGATIAFVGRNEHKNAEAKARLEKESGKPVTDIVADMTQEAEVERAVSEAKEALGGRIDILIANVGTNDRRLPQDYSRADWQRLMAINLDSVILATQAVYPIMAANGGGKILTIGSMLSLFGSAMGAPYSAAKAGVVMLTKSLANAWARDNIQVNSILPGWIDTDLTAQGKVQLPGLHERVEARTPAGRWGKPAEIAGAAVFLCSREADFITGVALPIDGGYSSNG